MDAVHYVKRQAACLGLALACWAAQTLPGRYIEAFAVGVCLFFFVFILIDAAREADEQRTVERRKRLQAELDRFLASTRHYGHAPHHIV